MKGLSKSSVASRATKSTAGRKAAPKVTRAVNAKHPTSPRGSSPTKIRRG